MMFISLLPIIGNVKAGTLRALAITSPQRSALLPDVPPISESGLPGFSAITHYGLAAPAGTPRADRRAAEQGAAGRARAGRRARQALGRWRRAGAGTPEAYAAVIDAEEKNWGSTVKSLNLKVE